MKKYRINEYLSSLTDLKKKQMVIYCCRRLNRSLSQFNKMRAIDVGDKMALNSDQLLILADCFGCRADDLVNKPQEGLVKGTYYRSLLGYNRMD